MKEPFSFQVAAWLESLQICHLALWLWLVCCKCGSFWAGAGRSHPKPSSVLLGNLSKIGVRVCVSLPLYTYLRICGQGEILGAITAIAHFLVIALMKCCFLKNLALLKMTFLIFSPFEWHSFAL